MQTERLLSKKQVRDRVSLCYTQIDRLEKAGLFPRRIILMRDHLGRPTRVAWLEHEITAWINGFR